MTSGDVFQGIFLKSLDALNVCSDIKGSSADLRLYADTNGDHRFEGWLLYFPFLYFQW